MIIRVILVWEKTRDIIIPKKGKSMTKQMHVRLDNAFYEALVKYTVDSRQTMQESVSNAIMYM